MHQFTTRRRIEFADTEMGGIVHFARFLIFMETAEHEFLNAIGTSVDTGHKGKRIGWPRVSVSCDYKRPARFGDELEIALRVLRKGASSMTYGFTFTAGGGEIATGRMTSVCCELSPGTPPRGIPIPDEIAGKIEEAPE